MFTPGPHSERDVLVGFLAQQFAGLRAAAHGLTDAQARLTPCRSGLSVGGLLKHTVFVLRMRLSEPTEVPDMSGFATFMAAFALTEEETLADVVAAFDAETEAYLGELRALDPAAEMLEPPAPWDGRFEATPSVRRFSVVHHIEEFARHAGHADILREEIDGATAGPLQLAVEGLPGNDFMRPWVPGSTD